MTCFVSGGTYYLNSINRSATSTEDKRTYVRRGGIMSGRSRRLMVVTMKRPQFVVTRHRVARLIGKERLTSAHHFRQVVEVGSWRQEMLQHAYHTTITCTVEERRLIIRCWHWYLLHPSRDAKYCDQRACAFACLFLCPLAYLKNASKFHQSICTCYLWAWPVLLWWQSNTLCTSGFGDDVTFSYNVGNRPESKTTHMFYRFARWRHRRRSLPFPTASCWETAAKGTLIVHREL